MKWKDINTDSAFVPLSHMIKWPEMITLIEQPAKSNPHGGLGKDEQYLLMGLGFTALIILASLMIGLGYGISWIARGCP